LASVDIQFDGTATIAELNKIRSQIPQALEAVGVYLLTVAQSNITSQGAGLGWPPAKRIDKKHPHQLEWLTGTMLRSLTPQGSSNIFQVSDNSVTIGSNVVYAAAQNFGNRHLPARPFLVFNSDQEEAAARVFLKYLLNGAS
jgi:phage gpG-like protein